MAQTLGCGEAWLGMRLVWCGKVRYNYDEMGKMKSSKGRYVSRPEQLLIDEFKKRKLSFEENWPLKNSFILDIAFPDIKLDVECDGEAFHGFPFGTERDYVRNKILERRGWKVIRFWSKDIASNVEKVVDEVEQFIKTNKLTFDKRLSWYLTAGKNSFKNEQKIRFEMQDVKV